MTLMHGTHNDITQYPTLFGIINDFHNVAIVIRHDKISGSSSPRSSSPRRRQVCAVSQLGECRTRNRESPGSNPVVTVSKFGHFLSLHDASVDSAV